MYTSPNTQRPGQLGSADRCLLAVPAWQLLLLPPPTVISQNPPLNRLAQPRVADAVAAEGHLSKLLSKLHETFQIRVSAQPNMVTLRAHREQL